MARYGQPSRPNPFLDEDDDDFGMGSSGRKEGGASRNPWDDEDDTFESMQAQIDKKRNNALQSAQRSVVMIDQTERIGAATAEEMVRQGEQLENTERKLDGIDTDLKTTQRHLTSIKSVFGGVVNYFRDRKEAKKPQKEVPTYQPATRLANSMETSQKLFVDKPSREDEHPAWRLRDPEPSSSRINQWESREDQSFDMVADFDRELDPHLNQMSDGMSRLRNLAVGLGDEIERQNAMIDRVGTKAETVDKKIYGYNKEMVGLLKK